MLRTLLSRRAREDARVDEFLHVLDLSARYRVDPDWALQYVPDDEPQPRPLSLLAMLVQA